MKPTMTNKLGLAVLVTAWTVWGSNLIGNALVPEPEMAMAPATAPADAAGEQAAAPAPEKEAKEDPAAPAAGSGMGHDHRTSDHHGPQGPVARQLWDGVLPVTC